MIKSRLYFWIVCDVEGCAVRSTDDSDYGAHENEDYALEEAAEADWAILGERHLCPEHSTPYRCVQCGDVSDHELPMTDGERMCPLCVRIAGHVAAGLICQVCWVEPTVSIGADGKGWCWRHRHGREDSTARPAPILPRSWTSTSITWTRGPNRTTSKRITMKRACSGCHRRLGDAHDHEIAIAMNRGSLPDTTRECGCATSAEAVSRG